MQVHTVVTVQTPLRNYVKLTLYPKEAGLASQNIVRQILKSGCIVLVSGFYAVAV